MPQHPLQLLSRQPAPEPPRVLVGSDEKGSTKALVQAGAAFVIGLWDVPLRINPLRLG